MNVMFRFWATDRSMKVSKDIDVPFVLQNGQLDTIRLQRLGFALASQISAELGKDFHFTGLDIPDYIVETGPYFICYPMWTIDELVDPAYGKIPQLTV